jgi:DNA-binding transcriptional LysR family regulator
MKEIERTRSISRAASNLGIAQPHLSATLKEMEIQLGFSIFNRNAKGAFPTSKGTVFLSYVDKILEQLKNINELAKADAPKYFSVSIPRGSYIVEGFIKFVAESEFKDEMAFDLFETNSVETINIIAEKRFNVGIIRYQSREEKYFLDYLSEKGLKSDLIWEFEMLLLMSPRNPLAGLSRITQDDLTRFVEIAPGDNLIPYRNMTVSASFPVKSGNAPQKKIFIYDRATQFSLLCSLPETYIWVSPVPENVLSTFNLIQRRCPHPENSYRDLLVFRKRYRVSSMDKNFIDCVYKLRDEVSLKNYR